TCREPPAGTASRRRPSDADHAAADLQGTPLDALTRGEDWAIDRANVIGVETAEPSLANGPFSGGLRHRLLIHVRVGIDELFVVWSPRRAVLDLAARLGGAQH